MKTLAAILVKTGEPLVVEEIEVPALKRGQVLVEVTFSGVCHTQVSECRGHRGQDHYLPHCLGHEGSGVVLEVGEAVTKVTPGDRVLLSWIKGSGGDVPGSVYESKRGSINAGGITTFSRHAVVSENRLTVLPASVSSRDAAILGCAVPTGIGAVLNTAQAMSGQSAVIFGVGGVGLCAVAGAVIAGCNPVVAVDINKEKLKAATVFGATHALCVNGSDTLANLRDICKNGFDFAIEASGRTQSMTLALESVRNQGGKAVVVGNARHGEMLEIDPRQLNQGKQLRGTWGGDNDPDRDFPKYFEYLASGKLNLDLLTSNCFPLSQINQAIEDLERGKCLRPLIEMSVE
ncbi:MAG: zinc-binding dehydrogenase [Candidatus Obscuribacterales bacterium]|nr:zinc-binding dehydrogenase [Candidatus Obscuribacterales bacterium]